MRNEEKEAVHSTEASLPQVRQEVHDLRGSLAGCCPICLQPWKPTEALRVVLSKIYWQDTLLNSGPIQARFLECLLQQPGKLRRYDEIHSFIYGIRADGGPQSEVQKVYASKLNAQFKKLGVPFKIRNLHGTGYVLVSREPVA